MSDHLHTPVLSPEELAQIKRRAAELYEDGWSQRLVSFDKTPKVLRHEDPILGGSGYWIDAAIFVPDAPTKPEF